MRNVPAKNSLSRDANGMSSAFFEVAIFFVVGNLFKVQTHATHDSQEGPREARPFDNDTLVCSFLFLCVLTLWKQPCA